MGEVYRARDTKLNRDVAVKVLPEHLSSDRGALERLEREAKALASTSHPSILAIFDFGTADGVTYAVMELLDGETIRSLLVLGALPVRKAIDYATQIADGLGAAHERGIVHRDLKPDNLFVTRDGRVKILDFGLARQQVVLSADDATAAVGGTEPGTVLGTVGYMSPEQVRGKPTDARADIFSFGAVLYEMLSGRRAFRGDSAAETLHAILRDDPADLTDTAKNLPPGLSRITSHCLEKSPDERFQSARDLAFDLKSLGTLTDSGRAGAVRSVRTFDARRALTYALLAATSALVGVLADRVLRAPPAVTSPVYHQLTFDRGTIGQARFAPDGQTIVYSAAWRGEPSQVYTTRIDSRESRPLGIGHTTLVAVSSASDLAVGLDTDWNYGGPITIGRVPLAGGAPRAIVEHVSFGDWSSDGSSLAIVRRVGAEQYLEFPLGTVIYKTMNTLTHLRVSPRGDFIAVAEHPVAQGGGSLVVFDRAGAKRTLSPGWADLWGIAWRPDGREVWFTAAEPHEYKSLRAATLDGRVRLVTRMPGQVDLQDMSHDGRVLISRPDVRVELMAREPGATVERPLTWLGDSVVNDLSLDGRRVLFSETDFGEITGESLYLRPTDGSPAVRLGDGQALALSPDGKWALALTSDAARLIALPTGAGEVKDLTRPGFTYALPANSSIPYWGAWLANGHRVVFDAALNGAPTRLFVQDFQGGDPKPFGPAGLIGQVVSPDGRAVAAATVEGKMAIYPLDDGPPIACKGILPSERAIRWSGDGRSLLCSRRVSPFIEVTEVEIATGRRKLLWRLSVADRAGAQDPDSVAVTPDGRSYAYSFFRDVSDLYVIDGLK
jgi:tRNA A-37 threonylcarbamoyl transferase component Bud32/Tol biopolymer transport system component